MKDRRDFKPFSGGAHIYGRGHLPHWRADGSTYFVTFRLADSLPANVTEKIRAESLGKAQLRLEQYLDSGRGECLLANPSCAKIVADAIQHFQNDRYELYAWCVMPNHAHAIIQPLGENIVEAIVKSWKSFSARKINEALKREGVLWQREYFDHIVRSARQLDHLVRYVAENPIKANLTNWPWVSPSLSELAE